MPPLRKREAAALVYFLQCVQAAQFPQQPPQEQSPCFFLRSRNSSAAANQSATSASTTQSSGRISDQQAHALIDQQRHEPRDHALEHGDERAAPAAAQLTSDRSRGRDTGRVEQGKG